MEKSAQVIPYTYSMYSERQYSYNHFGNLKNKGARSCIRQEFRV
jgi:hypothetical protein